MAADVEKPDQGQDANPNEISLENIDEILQQEDPEFLNSLGKIQEVADEVSDVELDTIDLDIGSSSDEESMEDEPTRVEKFLAKFPKLKLILNIHVRIKEFIARRWLLWKGKFRLFIVNSIDQAKTLPDRFKKLISDMKFVLSQKRQALRKKLDRQTRTEKTLFFGFILGLGFIAGLVILNIKDNKWIPFLYHPLIKNLGEVADKEWAFDYQADTVPFLTAFPQEKHNYLFPKVIVNLKLKEGREAFTMGAFEFFVEVDSKDTAIEVKSREVELHDLIQRVTEQFSYETLQSDRGKERLKEDLKKALNQKIVQGWVKDVYIKFFITKP